MPRRRAFALVPAGDEPDVPLERLEHPVDYLTGELVLEIPLGAGAAVSAELVDRQPVRDDGVVAAADHVRARRQRSIDRSKRRVPCLAPRIPQVGKRLVDRHAPSVELDLDRPHRLLVEREPCLACARFARGECPLLALREDVGRKAPQRPKQVHRAAQGR